MQLLILTPQDKIKNMWNNRKYVIIEANEVSSVDFSKVLEISANMLRYNVDRSKTVNGVTITPGLPVGDIHKSQNKGLSEVKEVLQAMDIGDSFDVEGSNEEVLSALRRYRWCAHSLEMKIATRRQTERGARERVVMRVWRI